MNSQFLKTLILGTAISSLSTFPAYADEAEDLQTIDTEIAEIDERSLSTGEDKVTARIADDFSEVSGGEDNAHALISGLRTGDEITIDDVSYENPADAMGFGETFISMALAQELMEGSDEYSSIADALGLDAIEEVSDSPEDVGTDGGTTDVEVTDSPQILVMRESAVSNINRRKFTILFWN